MADMESIKAKIRALRARTVENGCTEMGLRVAIEKVVAREDVLLHLRLQ